MKASIKLILTFGSATEVTECRCSCHGYEYRAYKISQYIKSGNEDLQSEPLGNDEALSWQASIQSSTFF
jgi:hypothetical protein